MLNVGTICSHLTPPPFPQTHEAAPPNVPLHSLPHRGNKINRSRIEQDDKIYWKLVSCKSSIHAPWRYHSMRTVWYKPTHTIMQIIYTRTVVVPSNAHSRLKSSIHTTSRFHPKRTVYVILSSLLIPFNRYSRANHLYTHCGVTIQRAQSCKLSLIPPKHVQSCHSALHIPC